MTDVRVVRVTDPAEVRRGGELFDAAPEPAATAIFLASPGITCSSPTTARTPSSAW